MCRHSCPRILRTLRRRPRWLSSPVDLAPLRQSRQFRLLWSSRTVTLLGTQVSQVALLVQARQLTGSAIMVGLLGAAEVLPLIIFGLYGGVLADRVDRRKLAIWTEAGLGLTSVLLTFNALLARPMVWPLYACAASGMALAALQRPSLDAAVPRLLTTRQLTAGSALLSLGSNAGAIAGPAIGGFLAAGPGPAAAYGLDAASFAISLGLLALLSPLPRRDEEQAADAAEQGTVLGDILAGLRYARGRPELVGSYTADLAAMLLAYPNSLLPFLAVILHAGGAVGLMFSAQAAGAVAASLTSRWISHVRRYGLAIVLSATAWGASTVGLGLAPGIGLALAFLAIGGAADMLSGTFRDTLWNRTVPDSMRGRMACVEVLSYGLGPSGGQIRAGAVADIAGARFALWSGGLLCIAALGLICIALPGSVRSTTPAPTDAMHNDRAGSNDNNNTSSS
jgi:MFS family permease